MITCISHKYSIHMSLPCWASFPIPTPSRHSRLSPSTGLSSLCYMPTSHQLSFLHMGTYILQCYSHNLSHRLLPQLHPQVCSLCEVDEPRAYHTEWSKSERETQILYINAYTLNRVKWYWWTYLQGRNELPALKALCPAGRKYPCDVKHNTVLACGRQENPTQKPLK